MKDEKKPEKLSEEERALKTALNILAYAECTEKTLRQKLSDKGYEEESVEFAVDYMIKHRYLDEKRYIFRIVQYLGNVKLYGKRRIVMQVKQKGFSADTVSLYLEEAIASLDERENCRKALEKVHKNDYKKTVDALLRRGFLYSDIKAAMSLDSDD
jgi:regulatory protein